MEIRHYPEQHYATFFNDDTGFFARVEDKGFSEPFWSAHGPELLDIAITKWCDKGCSFCYRKSDESGHHMSLEDYERLINQAKALGVFQVALGGGNPNQHPDFIQILKVTRAKYGIVPNYTTNGRGLTEEVLKATKEYCGAVAVSAYPPFGELRQAIDKLRKYDVKTNIHFILTSKSIERAIEWLNSPPEFLKKINALIFLNYKPVGKVVVNELLAKHSNRIEEFFTLVQNGSLPFRVGFDSCAVTGIAKFTDFPKYSYEGCDAGRFSMFVSEDLVMYPCSFMAETEYKGVSLNTVPLGDFWQTSSSVRAFRERFSSNLCTACSGKDVCLSGCPIFPEINLCNSPTNLIKIEY